MSSSAILRIPCTPQLTWEGMRDALYRALYAPPAPGTEYSGRADALRCGLEVAWGAGDDTGMERDGDAQGGGDGTGIEKGGDAQGVWDGAG